VGTVSAAPIANPLGMALSAPPVPPAPRGSFPGFLSALAYRNFRLLWIGAFLSSVGTWTQDVALAWFIHTRFRNPLYLGLQNFAGNAPLLTFMLVGGAVADRIDRRRILLTSQILQMSFASALCVLFFWGRLGIGAILLIAFLTGLAQSQSAPTYQAVLTTLVPRERIPNAVALNSLQFNLSRAVGPAIAGVLLVRAGTGACLATNAVSFLAVIFVLWKIQIPSPASRTQTLRESLSSGLKHVAQNRVLRLLIVVGAAGSFFAFPLLTYLPLLADDVLRVGAAGFSRLLSSFGVGAIVGAIVTAQRGHVPGRGRTLLASLAVYGVTTLGAVLSRSEILSMVLLFVSGLTIVSAFSILNSLVQENAPDELRGRVVSIYGLAFRGGMPLGSVCAGFLVGPLGVPRVIGAFSILVLGVALVGFLRSPSLRSL
jgi:MFS family permease